MGELLGRRLLERGDLQALRVHHAGGVLDHPALAGGVHALQDEQHRAAAAAGRLGVERLLQRVEPLARARSSPRRPTPCRGGRRGARAGRSPSGRGPAGRAAPAARCRVAVTTRRVAAADRRSGWWNGAVHRLWPQPPHLDDLDDAALAAHYAWPEARAVPYVRVNFVASLDGAVTVDGQLRRAGERGGQEGVPPAARAGRGGPGRRGHRAHGELQRRAAEHPRPRHPAAGRGRHGDGGPRPGEPAVHRHRGAAADPDAGVGAGRPAGARWPRRVARSSCCPG